MRRLWSLGRPVSLRLPITLQLSDMIPGMHEGKEFAWES